jgi:hypothetical protein
VKHLALIGLGFTLVSCSTNPVTGVPTIGGVDVGTVQADAVAICSYLPTATTVASIISANNPLAITAEAVAQAICNAIAPKVAAAHRKAGLPYVYVPPTVVIQGNFVR